MITIKFVEEEIKKENYVPLINILEHMRSNNIQDNVLDGAQVCSYLFKCYFYLKKYEEAFKILEQGNHSFYNSSTFAQIRCNLAFWINFCISDPMLSASMIKEYILKITKLLKFKIINEIDISGYIIYARTFLFLKKSQYPHIADDFFCEISENDPMRSALALACLIIPLLEEVNIEQANLYLKKAQEAVQKIIQKSVSFSQCLNLLVDVLVEEIINRFHSSIAAPFYDIVIALHRLSIEFIDENLLKIEQCNYELALFYYNFANTYLNIKQVENARLCILKGNDYTRKVSDNTFLIDTNIELMNSLLYKFGNSQIKTLINFILEVSQTADALYRAHWLLADVTILEGSSKLAGEHLRKAIHFIIQATTEEFHFQIDKETLSQLMTLYLKLMDQYTTRSYSTKIFTLDSSSCAHVLKNEYLLYHYAFKLLDSLMQEKIDANLLDLHIKNFEKFSVFLIGLKDHSKEINAIYCDALEFINLIKLIHAGCSSYLNDLSDLVKEKLYIFLRIENDLKAARPKSLIGMIEGSGNFYTGLTQKILTLESQNDLLKAENEKLKRDLNALYDQSGQLPELPFKKQQKTIDHFFTKTPKADKSDKDENHQEFKII